MPLIIPSADLRNNYNKISKRCHETKEPIYVTRNGVNDLVVLSDEVFEKMRKQNEESEEEMEVTNIVKKFVVDINEVRCTILYPGESLVSIAQKYDIPQSKLLEYNELSSPLQVKEGDVIYLEKKKKKYSGLQDTYRVKANETLYEISQQFGIQLASLAKLNDIDIFSKLREGDTLYLQ